MRVVREFYTKDKRSLLIGICVLAGTTVVGTLVTPVIGALVGFCMGLACLVFLPNWKTKNREATHVK